MNIYSIYKITNKVNNKSYIGFSSSPDKRWETHITLSTIEFPKFHIHRAIKKYGVDNFCFEIIYVSLDKEHTLKTMENYFIEQYDTFRNGYNMTTGGEGTQNHKSKHLISQALKGKKKSEEHVRKICINSQKNWDNDDYRNMMIATRNTEEYKKKRSEIATKSWNNKTIRDKRTNNMSGRKFSEEHKKCLSEIKCRTGYMLIKENGETIITKYLTKFGKEFKYYNIYQLLKKKYSHIKDLISIDPISLEQYEILKLSHNYTIYDPFI